MRKILAAVLTLCICTMPVFASVYNTITPPPVLQYGVFYTLWNAETPTPGTGTTAASQQVALTVRIASPGTPFGIDGKFSAAPGAFEVDVQVAATDADTNYQTVVNGNITSVDATNNTFHFDYTGTARFARLLLRTRTNSVSITATITGG